MGAFLTNYQVRSKSSPAVVKALSALLESSAYVSPEKGGWVTVYDESSEKQDEAVLTRIAAGLSRELHTAVFGFLVHDSDIAAYWLYQDGMLADQFNSAPDYFDDDIDDETRDCLRGNPEVLLPLCLTGTTSAQIEAVIQAPDGPPVGAENLLPELARLLGMDDERIGLGFEYFNENGEELLPDASEFEPVGAKALRKKKPVPQPMGQPAAPALDMSAISFYVAIGMLTKCWTGEAEKHAKLFAERFPDKLGKNDLAKELRKGFDRGARDFLKGLESPVYPAFEELKAARDKGPEALAKLLAERTPAHLGSIAAGAVGEEGNLENFVSALLAAGLNPNATDHHGNTLLSLAERKGKDSLGYRLIKSALDQKT